MTGQPIRAGAADGHALILANDRLRTPSGIYVTHKVTSMRRLLDVILHCFREKKLSAAGLPAQVWILNGAGTALGWGVDQIDPGEVELSDSEVADTVIAQIDAITDELLKPELAFDGDAGWHLFRPPGESGAGESGWRINLSYQEGRTKYMVDLLLEGWAWTQRASHDRLSILGSQSEGTEIDFDDDMDTGRELGRRLNFHVEMLDILPGNTPARSGAALADKIWRKRRKNDRAITKAGSAKSAGAYPKASGPIPAIDDPDRDSLEPPLHWARPIETDELVNDGVSDVEQWRLLTIDQRASYLGSAGMINLGLGELIYHADNDAEQQAFKDKVPFGIWHVQLPALATIEVPERLPAPHPRMRVDQVVDTWITTESLKSLLADVDQGGAGLGAYDLEISECWVTDDQGMALKAWKEKIVAARKRAEAEGDRAMLMAVNSIYRDYYGRIQKPHLWSGANEHHYQPLWAASIRAHARHRNRVKAMKVAAEHGFWPITGLTDAWTYLVPEGIDLADELDYLGKFKTEVDVALDNDKLITLLNTATSGEVWKACGVVSGKASDSALTDRDGARDDAEDWLASLFGEAED